MDFENIKTQSKIIDLLGGYQLKKVATTGGGELAGPCPFCGGKDRFRVQPNQNIWLCRNCTGGKWRDVIDFIAKRDNISIAEAAQAIAKNSPLAAANSNHSKQTRPTYTPYQPPPDEWQKDARQAVEIAQLNLFSELGAKALAYLHKRGLYNDTIKRFKLGFSSGFKSGSLWIPYGITIPCEVKGVLWYVKLRTNHDPKYTLVKGSKPGALYNADRLTSARLCLITEGEFNAMTWDQELNDVMPVASMGGSASNRIDLVNWGAYFINKSLILAVYDDDEAGQAGLLAMRDTLGERVKIAILPDGHDLNSYYQAGGCLWTWAREYLQFWEPGTPSILEAAGFTNPSI